MRIVYTIALTICGTLGGWLGALMDNGNWFGGWSIILTGVGSAAGIWLAYKFRDYF